ncbi:hypothetical protein TMatcc_007746 [Talaromyces marneffei ATCC 18224]|uniref:uncharacterized protein n=1 Tax=Talaromyces marneffei TaxID=37727 RepID=UPI0012A917AF|nr:uncharacterized protein EYB26_004674 [Talaromyces marneffei]KAE8552862.1 hypothetical protein EYB25_004241 [Talaromyces marneffei]QGA17004.1 hypothetical protein EYB26_004674 [Talaromyces marneffei]
MKLNDRTIQRRLAATDKIRAIPRALLYNHVTPPSEHRQIRLDDLPGTSIHLQFTIITFQVAFPDNKQLCLANTPSTSIRPGLYTDSLQLRWELACGFS